MKLSDIIQLHYGKSLPSRDRNDGKVPVYGSGGITGYHDQALIDGPGIIVGRKGSIGTIYFEDKDFFPIDTVFYVEHDEEKIDQEYLYFYLKEMNLENMNTDAAVPGLNRDVALSQEVSIPDLTTQQKIASILSAFDDLIENNTRRIEILEEMARRIYREWFVHFRYPGHEDDDLVDSGTELGEIPEGWEVTEFGELVEYLRDRVKNEEVEKEVSVLGLGDMPKESINLSQWENTDDIGSTKLRFKKDDILFGKIRPYFHKVGFAQTSGVCSSDIFVWRPHENKDYVLALLAASSKKFVETATNSSSGTKMPRAKWDVLENFLIPYPSEKLLGKLNSLVGSSLKQIRTLSFQNKRLKETRDLLLPKLISGKIDVEESIIN